MLTGRVGGDPEVKRFNNGNEVAEFSVATSRSWRDSSTGEKREKTHWHNVKVLNSGLIKNVLRPYVTKGSLITVEGDLENEEWEKDGQKRRATKVVVNAFSGTIHLLGSKDDNGGGDRGSSGRSSNYSSNNQSGGGNHSSSHDLDDDIPF